MASARGTDREGDTYDEIVRDLNALREEAGGISYAEIARRVTRLRVDRGQDPLRARPARTTVYDAFRTGRARMNAELVHDIVLALGATGEQALAWRLRVVRGRKGPQAEGPTSDVSPPAAPATDDAGPDSSPESPEPSPSESAADAAPEPAEESAETPVVSRPWARWILAALVGGALNLLGHTVQAATGLPLYLDMIGTGFAAMGFGIPAGLGAAVLIELYFSATNHFDPQPLALVALTGAVLWGLGMRSWGMGRSIARFFLLQLLVACACTMVAAPIVYWYYGMATGSPVDALNKGLAVSGLPPYLAVFVANLITSVVDKLLTGFIALAGLDLVARWLPQGTRLPVMDTLLRPFAAARAWIAARLRRADAVD